MHVGLGPDVDAVGRLVEDQDPRLGREPLREHDLLLIAAGEAPHHLRGRVGLDPQLLHEPARRARARAAAAGSRPVSGPEAPPSSRVLRDRHRLDRGPGGAVLRQVGEAAAERRARRPRPERAALDPEPALVEGVDSEDRARHLGPAGADEAGEADDLAAPELERDVGEEPAAGEALGAGRRRRRSPPPPSGRAGRASARPSAG